MIRSQMIHIKNHISHDSNTSNDMKLRFDQSNE